MNPIEQAIEALESVVAYDENDAQDGLELMLLYAKAMEQSRAALVALRSMPVEPVATIRYERGTPGKENDMPKVVSCNWLPDGVYSVYTTPPPAPVLSDAEIDAIGLHCSDYDDPEYFRVMARAIEQAIGRASRGAK